MHEFGITPEKLEAMRREADENQTLGWVKGETHDSLYALFMEDYPGLGEKFMKKAEEVGGVDALMELAEQTPEFRALRARHIAEREDLLAELRYLENLE